MTMRIFPLLLLLGLAGVNGLGIFAQETVQPRPPAFYGGSAQRSIDLRNPMNGSIRKQPFRDFEKYNPAFRSLAPLRRNCSTLEMELDRAAKQGAEKADFFENWMEQRLNVTARTLRRKGLVGDIYTLPVVVHVIYSRPDENLSREQILSQIDVLNRDFRRQNGDANRTVPEFVQFAADCEIEFCLATVDPQGRPTDGIDRISMSGAPFRDVFVNETIKPSTIWDPTQYMNIWVCNLANGILGFAQFPSSSGLAGVPEDPGAANTDGVVIHYQVFGTTGTVNAPFNGGRTVTHEVGHWLGLRHVWGDGGCEATDFCDDTPETPGPNFGCPQDARACNGSGAMVQNFMEYSDDACMNLFTREQRGRMRAVLENSTRRRELINSTSCRPAAPPPAPAFEANARAGCAPFEVNFRPMGIDPTYTCLWQFPGGTPATSNEINPRVTYRSPGRYAVTLIVSNAAGQSPATTRQGYIWVREAGMGLPIALSFEKAALPDSFSLLQPDGGSAWEHTPRVSGFGRGSGALVFNNFEHNLRNSGAWLLSPVLSFEKTQQAVLSFDIAYAAYSDRYADTLGVFISTACKSTFQALFYRGGKQLATVDGELSRAFTPQPEEWKPVAIDLSAFDGQQYVQIAFVNFSGYGNNLYLDNIRIGNKARPLPEARLAASKTEVCSGEPVSFSSDDNSPQVKKVWTFPGGIPAADSSERPVVRYDRPGSYDVILTLYSGAEKKSIRREAFVQVKPLPELRLSETEALVCPGTPKQLSVSGAQQYHWAPESGLDRSQGPVVMATPAEAITYHVTGIGANGCSQTRDITLRLLEREEITVLPSPAVVCAGQSLELIANGAEDLQWSPAIGLNVTRGPRVTAAPQSSTTYTVSGRARNGCAVSREVPLAVESPAPIYARASKAEVCPGEQVTLTAIGSAQFRWKNLTSGIELEGTEILVRPTQATTWQVTSLAGCHQPSSVSLTMLPKPSLKAGRDNYVYCGSGSLELQVSGAERVAWLPAEGLQSVIGTRVSVNPRLSTIYTAMGIDAANCRDTLRIPVAVSKASDVFVSAQASAVCPGMSTVLRAGGAAHYRWSPGESLNTDTGPEVIATPQRSTTYLLTATDANGCVMQANVEVTVSTGQAPEADFGTANRSVCAGSTVEFVPFTRFATAYRWEFPGGSPAFSSEQKPRVRYDRPGTYDVVLRVNGCGGRAERIERAFLNVAQRGRLLTGDTLVELCVGDSVVLSASGMSDYRWGPATGLDTTIGPRVTAKPTGDIVYTLIAIDENACLQSQNFHIRMKGRGAPPVLTASSKDICEGDVLLLQGSGSDRLTWRFAQGGRLGEGPLLELRPSRSTTYVLESTDRHGCVTRSSVNINVKPSPRITLSPAETELCAGKQAVLQASGAKSYTWQPEAGLEQTEGEKVLASPKSSTRYTVTGADIFGCKGTATASISVRSPNIRARARDSVVCAGGSTVLFAEGGRKYSWTSLDALSGDMSASLEVRPMVSATWWVEGEDEKGCKAEAPVTVRVEKPRSLPVSPAFAEICHGETITLRGGNASDYQWLPAPGLIASSGATATVRPASSGSYQLRGFDANGCEVRGAAAITVKPKGQIRLSASAATICAGQTVTLRAEGAARYQWLPTSSLPPEISGSEVTVQPQGPTLFSVVATNGAGCQDSARLRVDVRRLSVSFDMSDSQLDLANEDGSVQFRAAGQGVNAWAWDFGTGLSSTQQVATHVFSTPGRYEIRLTASDGICTATASRSLPVLNSSDLDELTRSGGLKLVPATGAANTLFIEMKSPRSMLLRLLVQDPAGKTVLEDRLKVALGNSRRTLNLGQYAPGLYTLIIRDEKREWQQKVSVR